MTQENKLTLLERLTGLREWLADENTPTPATEIYNETWLLRVTLDWYQRNQIERPKLAFMENAKWFSEGRLETPFSRREKDNCVAAKQKKKDLSLSDRRKNKADPYCEGHTVADAVIGHFCIDETTKSRIKPKSDAKQLIVIEAKLGSPLSGGVENAPCYDQAARSACCLAHIARESKLDVTKADVKFCVVAPEKKLDDKIKSLMSKKSIEEKVKNRANDYGKKDGWYDNEFKPYFDKITLERISWESIIKEIDLPEYTSFYDECKKYVAGI